MKSQFTSLQVLSAAIIVLVSATTTRAQTLHHDWTFPGTGTITNLQHMTVIDNGVRYVAEDTHDEPGSNGFSIAKYNDDGDLVWRTPYVPEYPGEFFEPVATAYNNGVIFVLGNLHSSMYVVSFSDDHGTQLHQDYFGGGFIHSSRGIVADPAGTGVIVTGVIRYTDPDYWLDDAGLPERRHVMQTVKYDRDLNRVWPLPYYQSLGTLFNGSTQQPYPTPRMITADADGSFFVTGVLDVAGEPITPPYRTSAARAFTLKFNTLGVLDWIDKSPVEPSITNFGYDTDYDATGSYTIYQSSPTHLVDAPVSTGMTVLTKHTADGSPWTPQRRPSRIRNLDVPDYGGALAPPDGLVVDKTTSSAYIAYDEVSASSVALEKYDATGRLWPQRISIGASTSVQSVVLDKYHNVVVGVNNDVVGKYGIFVFGPNGNLIDKIEVTGQVLKQLVVDDHSHIHAICTISGSATSYFVSRFSLVLAPEFSADPELLRHIPGFGIDLFAHSLDECWTGPLINWDCLTPPFCDSPKEMEASLMFEGKTVWESKFIQPFNTAFPQSKDFRTFSLKVNDGQMFQEVLLIDDKLVKNGATQLSFKTNSLDHSVNISMATNGAQIPITISFLNSQGKALSKEQFMAPFQKQLSEKFNEPVASISINGPEDKISFNYYPNPSNGAFTVELDKAMTLPAELAVYDMQGFRIHQQMLKEPKAVISLSGRKPGLYVLQINSGATEVRELIQIK